MILATPAFALTLLCAWRSVVRRLPLLAAMSVVCAAMPYAWMVWRSNQDPVSHSRYRSVAGAVTSLALGSGQIMYSLHRW